MRPVFVAVLLALMLVPALAEQPLSPALEDRANKLEYDIMARCCYNGTIADHESAVADNDRAELRDYLRQGMTDQRILDAFVARYGEKILAAPPATGGNIIVYILPFVGLTFGIGLYLRRLTQLTTPGGDLAPATGGPSRAADPYQRKLREELERLE